MPRRCSISCLLLLLVGQAFFVSRHAVAAQSIPHAASLAIVALPPEAAAEMLRPGFLPGFEPATGIGVLPDSRRADAFWREASAGAPTRSGERKGKACALRRALGGKNARVDFVVVSGAPSGGLRRLLCAPSDDLHRFSDSAVRVFAASNAGEARIVLTLLRTGSEYFPALGGKLGVKRPPLLGAGAHVLVLSTAERTPILVGLLGRRRGMLEGIARRPGIVTPYDVTATIARLAGVSAPAGTSGDVLTVAGETEPLESTLALAQRLERDAGFGPAVAGATIGVLLGGGVVLPIILLLLALAGVPWAPRTALRAARGAAAAVSGYVASLFVPTGNAGIRAIPIVVAYVLGAVLSIRDATAERRRIGLLLGVASVVIAVLAVAAALRPGGEPALSLWGNPLVSWRLFGLRNHLTSMLALGVLAGVATVAIRASAVKAAVAGVAGVIVVGAAFLGANFVAVLTLTFGASLVVWILATNRVSFKAAVVSGALGLAAFAVALLADSGSPVSHGGRAVEQVRRGGLHTALNLLRIRWHLNTGLIGDLWGGWVWTVLLVAGLIALLVWSARDESMGASSRAVLFGGSAAALAALVAEDTGFLAGGIIALAPALVAATELADRLTPLRAPFAGGGQKARPQPQESERQ